MFISSVEKLYSEVRARRCFRSQTILVRLRHSSIARRVVETPPRANLCRSRLLTGEAAFSNPPVWRAGRQMIPELLRTPLQHLALTVARKCRLSAVTRATIGSFAVGEPVAHPMVMPAGRSILEFRACCRSVSSLRELHAYWSGPVLCSAACQPRPITGWPGGGLGQVIEDRPFRLFVGELSSSFTTYQGRIG